MEATYVDGFVCKFDPLFENFDLVAHWSCVFCVPISSFWPHHLGDFSPPPRRRKSPRCCRKIAEVLDENRRGVGRKSPRCCRKITEVLGENHRGGGEKRRGGSGEKTYFCELVPSWSNTSAIFPQHLSPTHRWWAKIAEVLQKNRRGVAEKSTRCGAKIAEVWGENRRGVAEK